MTKQNQILKWVYAERKRHEKLAITLARLLQSARKRKAFLDLITQNPRDNKPAFRTFSDAFQTRKDRQKWLSTYTAYYAHYMNALLKKANRVEDILKIVPNLLPWTLEQRFETIRIGSLPPIFQGEKDFFALIDRINRSTVVKNFKKIKKLECHLPDFKKAFPAVRKIDWFDFGARSAFLRALFREKCGRPFTVLWKGQSYRIQFLCNPFSNKMVFQIKTPDHQLFILKESPYNFLNTRNDRVRKEHENMAIRADSTYSDALLEFYLKLNQCPHAPDILYYHFNHEVALYTAESGHMLKLDDSPAGNSDFYSFNTRVIPDSARLGVYVNDINAGNFLVSEKDKTVKIIDIGHATFANPLTPGVPGLTFTFGNLCGRDYIATHGVLDMEDV